MSEVVLPEGWVFSTLEQLISKSGLISDGDWIETKDQDMMGSVRLIQLADIGDGHFRDKSSRFMTVEKAKLLNCTYLEKGDILIARMPDPLGRACIFPEIQHKAVTVVDICLIRTGDDSLVSNRLLKYWINSPDMRSEINKNASGTTRQRITRKKLETLKLPLPPLAEQKVIADKLDSLLAQVDNIKNRLDALPTIIKRFKQSVLSAAVSGKLTEDWRGSAIYSKVDLALSKSKIETAFAQEWQVVNLEKIAKIISGNAFKSNDFIKSGVPVIKISNIQYGEFEIKNQEYLPSEFLLMFESFSVNPADVLMALTRPITNDTLKICRYPLSAKQGLLNQRVCKFDFCNEKEKAFFELVFQSSYFKSQVEDNLSETLQPNLSPTDLKKFIVGAPSLEEQTEIVRRVEQLFAYADQIEQQVKNAQNRVNNLTQAILAKAFRGELTADWRAANPHLISGENSAQALLAKIKAERDKAKKTSKQQTMFNE